MKTWMIINGILDIFRRKKKPQMEEPVVEPKEPPKPPEPPEWLKIDHSVDFEGDTIRIRVRINLYSR
jgi:hypothetical protein